MNLRYVLIGIVSIYGLLSIVAAIGGMTESGMRGQLILFLLAGISLMLSPWVPNTLWLLLVGLIGLHFAAIWQGLDQGGLQWSHHLVRAIVSVAILFVYFRVED